MAEEAAGGARGETFDTDLMHAIFKLVWSRRTERGGGGGSEEVINVEPVPEMSRRNRSTTEAVQRSVVIAEAEGTTTIEPTHLERVLPQLLLDF